MAVEIKETSGAGIRSFNRITEICKFMGGTFTDLESGSGRIISRKCIIAGDTILTFFPKTNSVSVQRANGSLDMSIDVEKIGLTDNKNPYFTELVIQGESFVKGDGHTIRPKVYISRFGIRDMTITHQSRSEKRHLMHISASGDRSNIDTRWHGLPDKQQQAWKKHKKPRKELLL